MRSLRLTAAQDQTCEAHRFGREAGSSLCILQRYVYRSFALPLRDIGAPSLGRLHLCRVFRSVCGATFCLEHALGTSFIEGCFDGSTF